MENMSVRATTPARSPTATEPRLSGHWLLLARVIWLSVAVLLVASFLLTVPLNFAEAQQVCTGSACDLTSLRPEHLPVLAAWGFSLTAYAAFFTVLGAVGNLAWVAMGVLLFVRRSAEPRALFFSFFLLLFGGGPTLDLGAVQPIWWLPVAIYSFLTFSCLDVFLYVFPTGQFVPRWTRWAALTLVVLNVPSFFFPDSPLGGNHAPIVVEVLFLLSWLGSIVVAQIYRYRRRSTPLERQQTKWVLLALGIFFVLDVIRSLVVGGEAPPLWLVLVFTFAYALAGLLIPVAIAASISRYRLWEIDHLINKVLVYGLLTGLLGAVYGGLILGLQALFSTVTGQTDTPSVVIVFSTLAIAALFLPVRRRIQQLIDRRFYRRKYDAEQTLAAFSAALRNEVDLEQVQQQLLAAVQETMQPEHASLWLHRLLAPPPTELAYHLETHEQSPTDPRPA
jgi:hypothetical protein